MSTGFARRHPEIEIDEIAAKAARPSVSARPTFTRAAVPASPAAARAAAPAAGMADGPADERVAALAAVAAEVGACVKCALSVNRTMTVPGDGPLDPPVMFIGEAPGADEDRSGHPFVGAAGQYLDTWLTPIGLKREECFIANCIKCRPPQNREPHPEELAACLPYLERQIGIVRPRVICCLGRIAAQNVLGTTSGVGELRGRVHTRKGIPVVVTYHPSAVLRDKATLRKPVWDDLKLLKSLLAE